MGNWYLCELRCQRLCAIDPDNLYYKNELACALYYQGNYAKAEALHQQCWEARKNTLGEHHPDTLRSLRNMALALHKQGKYAKAEALHQQCWEARKKTL
eukprot:9130194-Ditylum_brightwellii.AAC.1